MRRRHRQPPVRTSRSARSDARSAARSAQVAEDGELLFKAPHIFRGYRGNEEATKEALEDDGWFHTGDIGEIDDDGFVKITGRKKELIVTAGGKNVAPAVLEDRVRGHWLVSQCLVVGDQKPFIAALVTIDPESLPKWLEQAGKPTDTDMADLVDDEDLRAEIQKAIDDANKAVSKAESIRKFAILRDGLDRGGRPDDPVAQAQAQRRRPGVRGPDRRPLRRGQEVTPPVRPHPGPASM